MSGAASSPAVCVVLVPVLRRPENVAPLLESLAGSTEQPVRALFITTRGDRAELDAIDAAGAESIILRPFPRGDYARKINAGAKHSAEPFLFLGADDLRFHPGWLEAALAEMADPACHVVGTNDLGQPRTMDGTHATHSLVRRSYVDAGTIDEPGKLLHEGYWHEFVDDEFVETARARGAYRHALGSVVEHLHPMWGKAATDPLYNMHGRRMRAGRVTYLRRRHLWAR